MVAARRLTPRVMVTFAVRAPDDSAETIGRAQADGDQIYATILSSAVNQDGRTSSIVVPSEDAQAEMIQAACQRGGIDPANVNYVEAHGTGTVVGDRIEATALGRALGVTGKRAMNARIGSVKTNIGHLEPAAGVAGLIKTALAIKHGQIPASLHFKDPNPYIDFDGASFAGRRLNLSLGQIAEGKHALPESTRLDSAEPMRTLFWVKHRKNRFRQTNPVTANQRPQQVLKMTHQNETWQTGNCSVLGQVAGGIGRYRPVLYRFLVRSIESRFFTGGTWIPAQPKTISS